MVMRPLLNRLALALSLQAVLLAPAPAAAQVAATSRVTGAVRTDGGVPIPGALVTITALRLSTTTNDAGAYTLVVPAERVATRPETLFVTRLGYRPSRVPFQLAPGTVRVDVAMSTTAVSLEQVVVTGTLGDQRQRVQSAVVSSIDAASITSKAPILNVSELLIARTPGVSVVTTSGTTGAASRINIRGQASINLSNNPLVFIDGVKVQSGARDAAASVGGQQIDGLSDLNPDDIESIEIVKGPAAAALYGADASAGVIQILTKRGTSGARSFTQRLTTEYHGIDANFTPEDNYYRCLAADVAPASLSFLCRGQAVGTVVRDNPIVREGAFRKGNSRLINYSVQGGGDRFGFFASFNSLNEDGTLPNNTMDRKTGRANFNWSPTTELSLESSLGFSNTDVALPVGDQGSQGYLIGMGLGSPRTVRQLADGQLVGGWLNAGESVQSISAIENTNGTVRVTPGVTVRYSPRPWFTNSLVLGADITRQDRTTFYPKNDLNWYSVLQNTGAVNVDAMNQTQYTVTYQGNLNNRLGASKWLSSDFSFGTQFISATTSTVSAGGTGLITNSANTVSQTGANRVGGQAYGENRQFGVFAQEMLGIGDRLYIKLAGRMDQASAFARNAQRIFLPSYGISYILSDEPAWQGFAPDFISTLKLRAAYGETGRSPNSTAALQTYVAAPYVTDLGLLVTGGVAPGNPGNPDLKPERGTEFEAGLDAGFFNNRVGLDMTYFAKVSNALIVTNPLPPSSGFSSSPNINIGRLSNKGLEIAARATPIDRRNLTWDINLTMNTLANKLVTVRNIAPLNDRRCQKAGVEFMAWCVNRIRSVDTVTGVVTVSDTAEFLGGQLPKREGALSTTVSLFRNFRFYAQADGKFDYLTYNFGREFQERSAPNSARGVLTREELGMSRYDYFRLHPTRVVNESGAQLGLTQSDEDYFEDGSFVRLREMSLTWTMPASVARTLRVAQSSITVGGRNLAVWTDYMGYDPEVIAVPEGNIFRADLFTIPPSRRFFARLNLQF